MTSIYDPSLVALSLGVCVVAGCIMLLWRRRSTTRAELAANEQFYRDLVESARIVLWRSDAQMTRCSFINDQAETLLGYPATRWLSEERFWDTLLSQEDRDLFAVKLKDARTGTGPLPFEHRLKTASGSTIWVRTSLRLVHSAPEPHFVGLMLDITGPKHAEQAFVEERRLFESLMDACPECIYFKDLQSRFVRINKSQAQLFGLTDPSLAIGKSDADFFASPHAFQAFADEQRVIATGQPLIDIEEEETWADGRITWVATTKMALHAADGSICGTMGISRSITERKLVQKRLEEQTQKLVQSNADLQREMAERHLLEAQLVQAQKLESIGQLAAGIAHEINTPIQYVGDNCHFLEDSFHHLARVLEEYSVLLKTAEERNFSPELVTRIGSTVEEIDLPYLVNEIPLAIGQSNEGIERVARIVRAMKEFSHPGSKEMRPVDLNRAIENTLIVCRNEWKLVADAETELDCSLPAVCCLPDELNQVVLNLVVNAAHAIADGKRGEKKGRIVVSTHRNGDWVEIRVKDDGRGIPQDIHGRIFDPFFTTKEVGRGTGQGLAIARDVVVNKHGGTLRFETQNDVGTTFIVRLPVDGGSSVVRHVSSPVQTGQLS